MTLENIEMAYLYALQYDQKHPGFDCLVCPQPLLKNSVGNVGNVFIGKLTSVCIYGTQYMYVVLYVRTMYFFCTYYTYMSYVLHNLTCIVRVYVHLQGFLLLERFSPQQ